MLATGVHEEKIRRTAQASQVACSGCNLQGLCMPVALSCRALKRLDAIIGAPRNFSRGRHLYRSGDPFKALYVVRAGFFKTDVLNRNGNEQVSGFHMAGELLGLDGIGSQAHACGAVALEDSEVCLIPFPQLQALSGEIRPLQHHLHKLMSREIVRDHGMLLLLGTLRAEERLAAFLLNLSQRFAARGHSATEFRLRMTRGEIGSYLGLHLVTVSHVLSRFQEGGLITVKLKHIRILDTDRLRSATGQAGLH